ncbi:TIGR02587 family membrane protein [Ramlibacter pallidus]|uniref:TIGR02587 family membrane protein n=1 Tax=Ramlibacter pallidus TaxID=2780087 RepID=A0ABR9RXT6_9BURK|nr:TIGR02587 family membrane protein [Ramlibacter pallidus]MBE7366056.1 TIGR02587 family membrane protein [Ramlibacter pallidus]
MSKTDHRNRDFGRGLARAFAGAVIFGLPLLMTMEMWWLGFGIPSARLALLLLLFFPFLVALSWHVGFEPTFSLRDDLVDALVAYGVGFVASAVVLALLGVLTLEMSVREVVGKVSLQAVPASIGALLAQSQLGHQDEAQEPRGGVARYASDLFIMGVGALFLAFNLAPTEEMLLIALRLPPWGGALLMVVSVVVMHTFVYAVAFRGQPEDRAGGWSVLARFSITGYAIALLGSAYLLWTFGRFDGLGLAPALQVVSVLGFPAAVGAAAARLIL